jgi:hypothetical protein
METWRTTTETMPLPETSDESGHGYEVNKIYGANPTIATFTTSF